MGWLPDLRQGFRVWELDWTGCNHSQSLFSMMSGNAMAVPVVGAVLAAMLALFNFGRPSLCTSFAGRPSSSLQISSKPEGDDADTDDDDEDEDDSIMTSVSD
jgi:hypothetical protein